MKNLLNIILVLCVWACSERTQARRGNGDTDFHTIQHSTLFPSSSACGVPSPQESVKNSSVYVLHRYGPCSSLATTSPTHDDDIFRKDQERVNAIQSKLSNNFNPSQSTDLPARSGIPIGTGNYIVTMGIGTPKLDQTLVFDTGSDLSWIQCAPCLGACYSQKEPIFNPSSSSSYSNASCSSPACASLSPAGIGKQCTASNCIYGMGYGDGSSTVGFLAKEKFTLPNSVVFDSISFGCGQNNRGLFRGAAGLLGLGRNSLSFPSQTAKTYNNIFSYCLPSSPSSTGHLTFGSAGLSNSVKFTPIPSSSPSSFYGLDIIGITVGGQKLAIPPTVFSDAGGIIDSGTVITRLPPKAYAVMRDAFKEHMSSYKNASGQSPFDTCYDFTGVETISIPKISFTFGAGAVVDLNFGGILVPIGKSQACLAFAGNKDDKAIAIYGNAQQKTFQVVYDGPGKRVGFSPNGCT